MRYRMSEGMANIGTPLKEAMERTPRPKEPEQEPVANVVLRDGLPTLLANNQIKPTDERLYTTPPQRKPLTDEQILHFVDTHVGAPSMAYPLDNSDWINFARAIEAAHQATASIADPELRAALEKLGHYVLAPRRR